jgi:hypothetical protein
VAPTGLLQGAFESPAAAYESLEKFKSHARGTSRPLMNEQPPKDLAEFLRTDYQAVKDEILGMQRLVDDVVRTFAKFFVDEANAWPYELVNNTKPQSIAPFSFSTAAMILFALSVWAGRVDQSSLIPAVKRIPPMTSKDTEKVREMIERQLTRALEQAFRETRRLTKDRAKCRGAWIKETRSHPITRSDTFGCDDPFTLCWLLEVLSSQPFSSRQPEYLQLVRERARVVVDANLGPNRFGSGGTTDPLRDILQIDQYERVSHSFPLLRVLQLREALLRASKGTSSGPVSDVSAVRPFLLERIHLHLAEAAMPDSQFDAADLVFALEGWVLSSPVKPNVAVINQVFQVLAEKQAATPYWRALRPFKVSKGGLALLPQSIEVANSLLRICHSPHLRTDRYFANWRLLFQQYAGWLLGRTFRGQAPTKMGHQDFVGWESDHTYTLDRVHLWQTSQALIFLEHYAAMLQEYIAETSFRLANFQVRLPQHESDVWTKWKAGEPLRGDGADDSTYHVYHQIEVDFIAPRTPGSKSTPQFSMLLYGPPGTGKTTLAKKFADQLNYRLVTITPSDFIAGGGEEVEARAKAIFDVLAEQADLVVLFDEIDHLLLDRDSNLYRQQGDVFKLLTPGMLSKLGSLAELRQVVLIISTNYYERIDRAIKRPGRIDRRYLVLPPNGAQRLRLLKERLEVHQVPAEMQAKIASKSVNFTYRQLNDLITYVEARKTTLSRRALGDAILKAIDEQPSLITLNGYAVRFGYRTPADELKDNRQPETVEVPFEELALLAYLSIKAQQGLPDSWIRSRVGDAINNKMVADGVIAEALRKYLKAHPRTPPL